MSVSAEVFSIVRDFCQSHPGVRFDSAMLGARTTILVHGRKEGVPWFLRFKTFDEIVSVDGHTFTGSEMDEARAAITSAIEKRL